MAFVESVRFMGYGCGCGAVVFAMYDRQRLAVHAGILHQSKHGAFHFNNPWARTAVLLFPAGIAVADVPVDFPADLRAAPNTHEERSHPSLVGGCSVRFLFAFGIKAAGLHPSNGATDRIA